RVLNGEQVKDVSPLVCCARYGRVGRHSDPTIGQFVNHVVNGRLPSPGWLATLTNPPGLYMQTPDFGGFETPDGTDPSEFWTVVRGSTAGPNDGLARILHATYSVPESKGYTVGDITSGVEPIQYGSQIAQAITMKLAATAFLGSGPEQTGVGCRTDKPDP